MNTMCLQCVDDDDYDVSSVLLMMYSFYDDVSSVLMVMYVQF